MVSITYYGNELMAINIVVLCFMIYVFTSYVFLFMFQSYDLCYVLVDFPCWALGSFLLFLDGAGKGGTD